MKIDFEHLSQLWRVINSEWHRHVDEFLVKNDLTHVDRMVLLTLKILESPSKTDIAASINVKPQNLTRSIQRLIDKSLVIKTQSKQDKRFARFNLSKSSYPIVCKLTNQNEKLWLKSTRGMNKKLLEQLTRQLETMVANLKES